MSKQRTEGADMPLSQAPGYPCKSTDMDMLCLAEMKRAKRERAGCLMHVNMAAAAPVLLLGSKSQGIS